MNKQTGTYADIKMGRPTLYRDRKLREDRGLDEYS